MDKSFFLWSAINRGENEEARSLINELGMEADYNGGTPLCYAIIYHNKDIFDYLIEMGADVNCLYGDSSSTLMLAVEQKDEYMIGVLLNKGARTDVADKYDYVVLNYVIRKYRDTPEIVKLFLDHGANPWQKAYGGKTIVEYAGKYENEELMQLLQKYPDTSTKTNVDANAELPDLTDEDAVLKYIWKTMVPKRGPAATIQGELLSAVEKIRYECADNGGANWDERFPQRGEFIRTTLLADPLFADDEKEEIDAAIDTILEAAGGYFEDDLYDMLGTYIYKFYVHHQEPIPFVPPVGYI